MNSCGVAQGPVRPLPCWMGAQPTFDRGKFGIVPAKHQSNSLLFITPIFMYGHSSRAIAAILISQNTRIIAGPDESGAFSIASQSQKGHGCQYP